MAGDLDNTESLSDYTLRDVENMGGRAASAPAGVKLTVTRHWMKSPRVSLRAKRPTRFVNGHYVYGEEKDAKIPFDSWRRLAETSGRRFAVIPITARPFTATISYPVTGKNGQRRMKPIARLSCDGLSTRVAVKRAAKSITDDQVLDALAWMLTKRGDMTDMRDGQPMATTVSRAARASVTDHVFWLKVVKPMQHEYWSVNDVDVFKHYAYGYGQSLTAEERMATEALQIVTRNPELAVTPLMTDAERDAFIQRAAMAMLMYTISK